jgi:hypothetical protein
LAEETPACYGTEMNERAYDLAQVNIALLREPLDSPLLADFVAALAPINALADASPGFVWRLVGDGGDSTAIRGFGDERIIVNMSTWASLDALADYVYKSAHAAVMRERRKWFAPAKEMYQALWWVPAGHRPTVQDAERRVARLRECGPTAFAFTFKQPFPAPAAGARVSSRGDDCSP